MSNPENPVTLGDVHDALHAHYSMASKPPSSPTLGGHVVSGPTRPAPYHPPADLDPGVIKHAAGDHYDALRQYLGPAEELFSDASLTLSQIDEAYRKLAKDPSKTDAAKALSVSKFAGEKQDRVLRKFDSVRKSLETSVTALERSLAAPMEPQAQGALGPEIRAFVRSLPTDERTAFMQNAVQKRDSRALQAVLGAPAYLSGLMDPQHAHYTRLHNESVAPEAVIRLDVTKRVLALVETRAGLLMQHVPKAMRASWTDVKRIREAAEASDKALSA